MHSEHRRQYHVRPAAEVYPGDRISTDQAAIDAVKGDRQADAAVDWDEVEERAQLVRNRNRPTPGTLRFTTGGGPVTVGVSTDVLIVREHTDGTAD